MTKEEFKSQFKLPSDGFLNPIDLIDTEIGFSVYKNRSQKGFKSLFRVFIKNEDLKNSKTLKPLIITASYGKETENGIVISSSEFERGINWPIELISNDEFFYNIEDKRFFYKNKEISGPDILKKIDEQHTKPTKLIKGLPLRVKLAFWRKWIAFLPVIFIWLLYLVSGDKITKNLWERKAGERSINDKTFKEPKEKESSKLDIFGYHASQWAVTLYSILHLVLFGLVRVFDIQLVFLSNIFANNFLIVMYVIPTLGFIDYLLPRLIKYLISKTTDFAVWASSKKIKI